MQRVRFDGRRIVLNYLLPLFILVAIIFIDQYTKVYFNQKGEGYEVPVIDGFFKFYVTHNKGAAFSMFADKPWGQTFFKVLTAVALVFFVVYYCFIANKYRFLRYGLVFIIAGTVGNYIDRLLLGYVVDFLSFTFFGWDFAVFNVADAFLCVGVAMLIIHYMFLDKNAIFKKKAKPKDAN